ncbi:MAG TPA: hypothetical protein VH333_07080 [Pseudonocardiaceae bacterium]|nr:hypothetical protein [Pseudonocardiaceae bacterium]
MTVQHGDNTLTMSSPDSQGTMQLTTQDGTGQQKTYDIDFGQQSPSSAGGPMTGTSGTGGTPTTATATPVSAQAPTSANGTTSTGPDGVQHVTPGPDGTATIHDGNTTITAQEQPDGEVKVTVDDGSGQPTTYTLDAGGSGTAQPMADPAAVDTTAVDTTAVDTGMPATDQSAGFTDPSTAAPDPSVAQQGFTDPSQGFTDPSGAGASGFSDPSTLAPAAALDPQATDLSSVTPMPLGGAVDPGSGVGLAAAFTDPTAGSSTFSDALGGAAGGGHAVADQLFGGGAHHDMYGAPGHAGLADTNVTPLGHPGDAGLASAPDQGQPGQQGQQGQQGGMPMMGGMGGMGGGGHGGDQERGPSQWRTYGQLFDEGDDVPGRFSGTLDDGR